MSLRKRIKILDEQGSALAEFVVVLPLFLLLIFAIIEISMLFSDRMILNYATYTGARTGAIHWRTSQKSAALSVKGVMTAATGSLGNIGSFLRALGSSTEVTKEGKDLHIKTSYFVPGRFPMVSKAIDSFISFIPLFPISLHRLESSYRLRIEK